MFIQRNVAYVLLITMLGLIAIGLVMLSSTSSVLATVDLTGVSGVYNNLRRQCAWLVIGGIACVLLSRCDYQKELRWAPVPADGGAGQGLPPRRGAGGLPLPPLEF